MANNQNSQQHADREIEHDETAEARSDRDGGKEIGIGYGKDAGNQGEQAPKAGGREGIFSQEDADDDQGLDTNWSPGAPLPRS